LGGWGFVFVVCVSAAPLSVAFDMLVCPNLDKECFLSHLFWLRIRLPLPSQMGLLLGVDMEDFREGLLFLTKKGYLTKAFLICTTILEWQPM